MNKTEEVMTKISSITRSKTTRNILFLVISIICIMAINSLLPIIEGSAKYTEAAVEMSYGEYLNIHEANSNYNLTWESKIDIENYKSNYIKEHPELTEEEKVLVTPPNALQVKVYTKFFFVYIYWYVQTAVHTVSALMMYYAVFNYLISKRKRTYERYLDLKKQVDSAVDTQLDPVTFEPWMMYTFNYDRKIKQHVTNVKYKMDKLTRHTSYKVRNYKDTKGHLAKKHARYIQKINNYKEQLTDTYIKEFVPEKKVKGFKYIHPTFVTSGYNSVGFVTDSYSDMRTDANKISNDGVKKTISSIALTTLLAVLLTFMVDASFNKPWYWIILNIIIKVLPLVLQVPLAYDYCESFMEDQLITNLLLRRSISLLYLAYIKNSQKEVVINEEETTRSGPINIASVSTG